MKRILIVLAGLALIPGSALAETVTVTMQAATEKGAGQTAGTVTVSDTAYGALFTPQLSGLTPGLHGFHVHENGQCGPAMKDGKMVPGLAAGGHFDPSGSGRHLGPYADGHLGDLPPLYVDADGTSTLPVLAPRLKVADIRSRSLMIHAGGDNFSDHPQPLGGGGARMFCGVIR
jgi:Cu-Zn family superoxide dismutase